MLYFKCIFIILILVLKNQNALFGDLDDKKIVFSVSLLFSFQYLLFTTKPDVQTRFNHRSLLLKNSNTALLCSYNIFIDLFCSGYNMHWQDRNFWSKRRGYPIPSSCQYDGANGKLEVVIWHNGPFSFAFNVFLKEAFFRRRHCHYQFSAGVLCDELKSAHIHLTLYYFRIE